MGAFRARAGGNAATNVVLAVVAPNFTRDPEQSPPGFSRGARHLRGGVVVVVVVVVRYFHPGRDARPEEARRLPVETNPPIEHPGSCPRRVFLACNPACRLTQVTWTVPGIDWHGLPRYEVSAAIGLFVRDMFPCEIHARLPK